MAEVPRTATPVSLGDFAAAAYASSKRLGYGALTPAAIAVAWAHFALETGYGKYCWNFNLGNHRWFGPSETADFAILPSAWECGDTIPDGATAAPEHDGGCSSGQVAYYPAVGGQKFAAFPSLAAGMDAYLTFLHDHYPEAYAAMANGDVSGFSHGLKQRGYYTADESSYTQKLASIFASYQDQVPPPSAASPLLVTAGAAAAFLGLWYFFVKKR